MPHQLPKLPYAYDALEPHIDAKTMEIHHSKHHQTYVNNLNKTLEGHPEFADLPLDELFARIMEVPESIRTAVRNNGGGVGNHNLYWQIMGPNKGGEPTGDLMSAIQSELGGFDTFKDALTNAGLTRGRWVDLRDRSRFGDGENRQVLELRVDQGHAFGTGDQVKG